MLKFEDVKVRPGGREILKGVTFGLVPGTITAMLGKNGSGKSTAVACLTGQARYTGTITWNGEDLAELPERERARRYAVLPQHAARPGLTVEELAAMGRTPYTGPGRRMTGRDREIVAEAMKTARVDTLRDRTLSTLSGGEGQRAYLALLLAQDTPGLILDEPTTYLDMEAEAEIHELLKELRDKHGKTILLITHDLTRAAEIADRMVILSEGRAVFEGTTKETLATGIVESVFGVRKSAYLRDGKERPLFYR